MFRHPRTIGVLLVLALLFAGCAGWLAVKWQAIQRQKEACSWIQNERGTCSSFSRHQSPTPSSFAAVIEAISGNHRLKPITYVELNGVKIGHDEARRIAWLPDVEMLDIWRCSVADSDTTFLQSLKHLEALSFSETPIGNATVAHLVGSRTITDLSLDSTQIDDEGLAYLADLPITTLSLRNTSVTDAGMMHLACLSRLERLELARTGIGDTGLAHLSRISSLQHLDLEETRVGDEGIVYLGRLKRLSSLSLRGDKVTDHGARFLAEIEDLRSLDLSGTQIGSPALVHLARLRLLKSLILDDTKVGDDGLRHLVNLKHLTILSLKRTKVTDAGIEYLSSLSSLEMLDLEDTQITKDGDEKLRRALPKVFSR